MIKDADPEALIVYKSKESDARANACPHNADPAEALRGKPVRGITAILYSLLDCLDRAADVGTYHEIGAWTGGVTLFMVGHRQAQR